MGGQGNWRWKNSEIGLKNAAEGLEASNALNSLRLGRQLAGDEGASVFTAEGELTSEALAGSREIIPAAKLGNPDIPQGWGGIPGFPSGIPGVAFGSRLEAFSHEKTSSCERGIP